ncbi:MAG: glycosyltransferase [Desulfatitalea sp.]|nr:glycosyltransferase [Desulfatitalea sp.]MBI5896281.1 glycosyltransferase [Desulfobacterales bacterium]
MDLTDLTLIVPTKNEAHSIHRFLETIPADLRVVFVDASTDGTDAIIRRLGRRRIHILRDDGNIAAARQLGAERAQTEWLLFTDADVLFAADYFSTLASLQPEAHWGGIVGAKLSRRRHRSYYRLFSLGMQLCCALGVPAASGSNMLVRRRTLQAAGGFDRRLSCNEDSELMWRIRRQGCRVVYASTLQVFEFDHRRLDTGAVRKTAHSLLRCTLLFFDLLHDTLRTHDWGYWGNDG